VTRRQQQPDAPARRTGVIAAAAGAVALMAVIAAGTPAPVLAQARGTAPLDSLDTGPDRPTAAANLNISRKLLPSVSTTTVPRTPPPSIPPRIDDPEAGERLFLGARHAARIGETGRAEETIRAALTARPGDSRLPLWQVMEALRHRDPKAVIWHLPGAFRTALADPLAAPRLAMQAYQGALLLTTVFWTVLVVAGLFAFWRHLAHDLSALIFRDPTHRLRVWTPLLLVGAVIVARPGWLGGLALLSVPLLLQARGRPRQLFLAVWLVALALSFPNWPPLREAVPVLDPDSETTLLVRAGRDHASPEMIQEIRERLAEAEDSARRLRLRLALGLQEARRGRYSASSEQFRAVLTERPDDVVALVGLANNAYFTSRFDEALAGYHQARELAPGRGEIPYNQAQVYFKKLFVPEAGQALEDARSLGFDPPVEQEGAQDGGDFSPAIYLDLDRSDLRASARSEMGHYPPQAGLAAWNYFLGAPPLPLFVLLGGLLLVAVVLTYWSGMHNEIRSCESCGGEICRGCSLVREGSILCRDCCETADRSRSEMVLATLLKNRNRTVGMATTDRLVTLARLVPGAAHLAIGETSRALGRLSTLALALYLVGFGWAFDPSAAWTTPGLSLAEETLHALWLPLPAAAWPGPLGWPVAVGWVLLTAVYAVAVMDGTRLRLSLPERLVHIHSGGPTPGPGRA
jgi:tetratricopeptide (TPR) repeat protein